METPYTCCFDIDYRSGDVKIKLNGDGHEIEFTFMLGFFSIPWFFSMLLQLWNGKTNKTELDGFGIAVRYYFTVRENHLFIKHLTSDDNGHPTKFHYKFDFKKFVKAVDKGFSDYLEEQFSKGILPLKVEEHSHPLSRQVIEEYNQFSTSIRSNLN